MSLHNRFKSKLANQAGVLLLLLPLSIFPVLAFSADLADVRTELSRDIATAQNDLSKAEATVSQERGQLAQRINAAQNRVLDLRTKAVAARRVADEETLSLGQIETRLKSWQDQSLFQSRLLAGFLDQSGKRFLADAGNSRLQDDLVIFAEFLTEQESSLYPTWHTERVVMPDGQLLSASMLNLGPVQWFMQENAEQSGLTKKTGDLLNVSAVFADDRHSGLQQLYSTGSGVITFDPTLSRALLIAEDDETLLQHLQKGGIWVVPILLFALFATVTAIFKSISLFRLPALLPMLAERVEAAMKDNPKALAALQQKVSGPQGALLRIALNEQTAEQRDDRLYACLLEQRNRLERWLGAVAMTASVSPLLGLLGTVSGMIATFKLMTLFGAGDASSVSSGISEALVTTELGLVVAIPALLAHALMSRKVKSYFSQLENDAVHLSQLPLSGKTV